MREYRAPITREALAALQEGREVKVLIDSASIYLSPTFKPDEGEKTKAAPAPKEKGASVSTAVKAKESFDIKHTKG